MFSKYLGWCICAAFQSPVVGRLDWLVHLIDRRYIGILDISENLILKKFLTQMAYSSIRKTV